MKRKGNNLYLQLHCHVCKNNIKKYFDVLGPKYFCEVVWLSLVQLQVIVCVQNWEECWSLSSVYLGCYRLFTAKARMRNFQFLPGTPRSLYWKQGNNKTKSGFVGSLRSYETLVSWFKFSNGFNRERIFLEVVRKKFDFGEWVGRLDHGNLR